MFPANLKYKALLGWDEVEVMQATPGATSIGDAIRKIQHESSLVEDGIMGPRTYEAFLNRVFKAQQPLVMERSGAERVALAGKLAVNRAICDFLDNIIDVPHKTVGAQHPNALRIQEYIRKGLGWMKVVYEENDDYKWCGAFAAYQYGQVGLSLYHRKYWWPSTLRLDYWWQYRNWEDHDSIAPANKNERRMGLKLDENSSRLEVEAQPGDILLVGPVGSGCGKHITLVESYDEVNGILRTIEGNGTGAGPTGRRQHGVIRNAYRIGLHHNEPPTKYHPRRLIRPSPLDFE